MVDLIIQLQYSNISFKIEQFLSFMIGYKNFVSIVKIVVKFNEKIILFFYIYIKNKKKKKKEKKEKCLI